MNERVFRRSTLCLPLVLALLFVGLSLAGPGVGLAQSPPPDDPSWWQTLPPVQPGFPVALSGAYLDWGSSCTLSDLDGDGKLEIIVAGRDLVSGNPGCGGMVYAYRSDGSRFWETHVRAPINSTPTTADLNGDGHPDVVVGMGGIAPDQPCWNGGVIALDGLTGQELWTFDTQDWLNHKPDGWLDGVFSTPAIGDVNGDGQPEIAFGAWDQCIYLLDRNGQPLWGAVPGIVPGHYCGDHGFYNEDTVWSSPALADINGDGRLEIIVGADISPGNTGGDPGGGYLYVLDANGTMLAREWMDQIIQSSPAVADLDNDGALEVVVGTGTYWANKGYYVSAFDYDPNQPRPADRLVLKWRKSTAGRVLASPAIADLDKDGWLDVVITSFIGETGKTGSYVYAWRGSDGALLFQRQICNFMGVSQSTASSPTVADVNGDTWLEVLLSHAWEVAIFNHDGTYYTDYSNPKWPYPPQSGCARDHTPTTELTYWAQYPLRTSPAIGDLDGDGDMEIIVGGHNSSNPNQGMIFAWTGHPQETRSTWPTWRHDTLHTGNYCFAQIPPTNPTSLSSSSHTPGTWSTSNQVQVTWSGAASHDCGLAGYSIVWDTVANTIPDAYLDLDAATTSATSSPLPDGTNHYFHLRTGDRAGNWTAAAIHLGPFWVDSTPPTSQAASPAVVKASFQVTWGGSDATSGVAYYTIEVRDGTGPWTVWRDHQTGTSATFQDTVVGHTYHFRSIAYDLAGNVETAYTEDGDTSTVVAQYLLGGTVYNSRREPVAGARVAAQPEALNLAATDTTGRYVLGLLATGTYTYDLQASQACSGALYPMYDVTVTGDMSGVDFYLPPSSNRIQNGDFESSGGWELTGSVAPARVQGKGHTGNYALQLGALPGALAPAQTSEPPADSLPGDGVVSAAGERIRDPRLDASASATWSWTASQTVSLPAVLEGATLAWLYRVEGTARPGDQLIVTVQGPTASITRSLPLTATAWTHDWLAVDDLDGQEVTVRFALSRALRTEPLTIWLDEVSLGPVGTGCKVYLPLVRKAL